MIRDAHKDFSGLKASCFARICERRHWWRVFLWGDHASMVANIDASEEDWSRAGAGHLPATILYRADGVDRQVHKPQLGELHFISGVWNLEIVAHECTHALLHRLRYGRLPSKEQVLDGAFEHEESICYEHGAMISGIHKWLWEVDQPFIFTRGDDLC